MKSEAEVQGEVKLALSQMPGCRIFRNNVAKVLSPSGRWVEYGLGVGSSDLIGFESVIITEEMLGERFARFVAIECKAPGKRPTEDQVNFINLCNSFGSKSFCIDNASDVKRLMTLDHYPPIKR